MKKIIALAIVLIVMIGGMVYMQVTKPIKIGFVGELSTTSSQLSVESREAFLFAVETYNEKGGINGRKIETYIYDDGNDNKNKESLHQKLQKDGVKLIVGFNVSAMAETVEYLMENGDYLIVSPTITTDYMTGKNDRFIKTSPTNALQADELFKIVVQDDLKRMLIVYSEANQLFAKGIVDRMEALMKADGREVSIIADKGDVNVAATKDALKAFNADGLFIVLNGSDTAQYLQSVRIDGYKGTILTSAWAATSDMVDNSGKYGEGVYSVEIAPKDPDEQMKTILSAYIKEKTGAQINFSHARTYSTTAMVMDAIEVSKSTDPEIVKKTIMNIGTFKGIETSFTVDQFGDTQGTYRIKVIKDGKFVRVN